MVTNLQGGEGDAFPVWTVDLTKLFGDGDPTFFCKFNS